MCDKENSRKASSIDEAQMMLRRLSEEEKEPYFKELFRFSSNMLREYNTLLLCSKNQEEKESRKC